MVTKKSRNESRQKRHLRIRKNISGTSTTPRLAVYRSNANIYAQVIDDVTKTTLVAASSIDKELKLANGSNIEANFNSLSILDAATKVVLVTSSITCA